MSPFDGHGWLEIEGIDPAHIAGPQRRPDDIWQHFFAQQPPAPLQRDHLFQRTLEARERWINYMGAPGSGRTMVLKQIADYLVRSRIPHLAIWSPAQAAGGYSDFMERFGDDLDLFEEYLMERTSAYGETSLVVIIDDYDCCATHTYTELLGKLMRRIPGIRLLTSTWHPLEQGIGYAPGWPVSMRQVSSARLNFTYEESTALILSAFREHGLERRPSDHELRTVFNLTRGSVLGLRFALDDLLNNAGNVDRTFARLFQAVNNHARGTYPAEAVGGPAAKLFETATLMPRFTDDVMRQLHPDASDVAFGELQSSRMLDASQSLLPGEHVWASDYWAVMSQRSAAANESRRELGTRLHQLDYIGYAFEQWLISGDLQRAEKLLRTRFLSVYETIAPEIARQIVEIPSADLRELPMLRKLRVLLDPYSSAQALDLCASNLTWIAKKSSTNLALIAVAVRGVFLTRAGRHLEAIAEAEGVLAASGAYLEQISHEYTDDHEDRFLHAEAVLIATLVMLESGTYPREGSPLPSSSGSTFLTRRAALAHAVIERARSPRSDLGSLTSSLVPEGYRALAFSSNRCLREVEAFAAVDSAFRRAFDHCAFGVYDSGQHTVDQFGSDSAQDLTRAPLQLGEARSPGAHLRRASSEPLYLLLMGNLAGAVKLAHQSALSQPAKGLVDAALAFAKGDPREALDALDEQGDGWGERIRAIRCAIRACALLRRGNDEAARLALLEMEQFADTAVVEAFSRLPSADGQALAQMCPQFGTVFQAARRAGLLCSGRLLTDEEPLQALTKKETEVLDGLRRGLNTREIAEESHLSVNTVRTHVRAIAKKLGASGQAEILRRAWKLRLFDETVLAPTP